MAVIHRIQNTKLLSFKNNLRSSKVTLSTSTIKPNGRKIALAASGVVGVGALGLMYALNESVKASDLELHPPKYPWSHTGFLGGFLKAFDHASLRRGYEVYKQVCAACHSLKFVSYRELVDVLMTEEQARAEAAEILVEDGPDDEGKMFQRPGRLSDRFPKPYPNEEAAKKANNGAIPPDLTYIVQARHGFEDYVFSILTGYLDPPAGVKLGEGQHFNPYFPGGALSMARSLYNETIEYSDGTPASTSQLAKDVVTFLSWTSQPEHDTRKKAFIKAALVLIPICLAMVYWKRHIWISLKSRKIIYKPKSPS